MTTFSVTVKDDGSPTSFNALGFNLGHTKEGGIFRVTSLGITFAGGAGNEALHRLLDAYRSGDPFDTLVINVKNDMDQLVQRVTLTEALVSQLVISSDTHDAVSNVEFVFDKVKLESASTPGGPLDQVFESAD